MMGDSFHDQLVTASEVNPHRRPLASMAKLWIACLESAIIDLELPADRANIDALREAVRWLTRPESRTLDPNGYRLLAPPLTFEGVCAGINATTGYEAVTPDGIRRVFRDKLRLAKERIAVTERRQEAKIVSIDVRKRELLEAEAQN